MTDVDVNSQNFTETTLSDKQILVPNAEGRTVLLGELVYLNGYFGNVTDQDGIVTAKSGNIDINSERKIRTEQITITETFVVDATIWFQSGGAGAAGVLLDADPASGTRVAVGTITAFGGSAGAHTWVEFRPYIQLQATVAAIATNAAAIVVEKAQPKILIVEVASDSSTAVAVVGLAEGDKIIGMSSICNVSETAGTIQLTDGTDAAISDALQQATADEVAYAATIQIDKNTLPATGAKLVATGTDATAVRCTVLITYIPVAV